MRIMIDSRTIKKWLWNTDCDGGEQSSWDVWLIEKNKSIEIYRKKYL